MKLTQFFLMGILLTLSQITKATYTQPIKTLKIKCEGQGQSTLNQFYTEGFVITDGVQIRSELIINVRDAGIDQPIRDLGQFGFTGTITFIPAGALYNEDTVILNLKSESGVNGSIILDQESSLLIRGRRYGSSCKQIL